MRFEWDESKARRNLREHGVSFREASLAFDDPHAIKGDDEKHSKHEPRQWLLGMSPQRRILLVVFTERDGDVVRLITARKATLEECELYENEKD
jgi:uncharacterized DUF497 family protein